MSKTTGEKLFRKIADENEFMEHFQKENETCSHSTCSKSIKLIKLQCQFCNLHFCTSHILSEIHGCGNAARKFALKPAKQLPSKETKQDLENKMARKLKKLANDRKKKGKQ